MFMSFCTFCELARTGTPGRILTPFFFSLCVDVLFCVSNSMALCRNIHCPIAKFLIDHEGNPYKRYNGTSPLDMKDDVEILLKKKAEGDASK